MVSGDACAVEWRYVDGHAKHPEEGKRQCRLNADARSSLQQYLLTATSRGVLLSWSGY